eukprot:jgi/Bigna1/68510/fgenesh1_pg.6_\
MTKDICGVCGIAATADVLKSRRHTNTKVHLACNLWGEGVLGMFEDVQMAQSRFHEATKELRKSHAKIRIGIMNAIIFTKELARVCNRTIRSTGSKFMEPQMSAISEMEQWLALVASGGGKEEGGEENVIIPEDSKHLKVVAWLCQAMWEHVKRFRITDTTVGNWRAKIRAFKQATSTNRVVKDLDGRPS